MAKEKRTVSYISGSTFFTLLIESKRDINSKGEDIPNYMILLEMSKIFKNDDNDYGFYGSSAVQLASKYRAGTAKAPQFMGFYEQKSISSFDGRVEKNRTAVLNKIDRFINEYLYIDNNDPWLIKALFDVISEDNDFDEDWVIFYDISGRKIRRKDLKTCSDVYAPEVLLGVWLYTLHHTDNKDKIKSAYSEWMLTEHDNSKHVNRGLFGWKNPICIAEYNITEDEEEIVDETTEPQKVLEEEAPAEDQEEIMNNIKAGLLVFAKAADAVVHEAAEKSRENKRKQAEEQAQYEKVDAEVVTDDEPEQTKDSSGNTTIIQHQNNVVQTGDNNVNITNNGTLNLNL